MFNFCRSVWESLELAWAKTIYDWIQIISPFTNNILQDSDIWNCFQTKYSQNLIILRALNFSTSILYKKICPLKRINRNRYFGNEHGDTFIRVNHDQLYKFISMIGESKIIETPSFLLLKIKLWERAKVR